MEDKKKIILDCDPGSDDAIAIMLALFSEKLDVLGITVVNGNRILPKTLENTLRMKQFLGSWVVWNRWCVTLSRSASPSFRESRKMIAMGIILSCLRRRSVLSLSMRSTILSIRSWNPMATLRS